MASAIADPLGALEKQDTEDAREFLIETVLALESEMTLPVEMEAQRVLLLADGKGPTALKTIAGQKLTNEEYDAAYAQRGELAVALHVHALHRRVFDDGVSFRNARLWRDGKLYSAFDVELDHPKPVDGAAMPLDKFLGAVKRRLQLPVDCGLSVVDLPETDSYKASVLLIVRIPKDITGIAEHLNNGGRRLRFLRPQKEVLLIYTPAEQRIEICADTAPERAVVSESFAIEVLGHNVSLKPLTWVNYDLSRFFRTLELDPPTVSGFVIERTALLEIEMRLARWNQRIRLSVPFGDEIEVTAQRYLFPARVMQRASGISHVVIAVQYRRKESEPSSFLEITISDRNRCNLLSIPDPEIRRLGRTLLTEWNIQQPFKDLSAGELGDFLSLLLELYEQDADTVPATFFSERNVDPDRLLEAKFIVRKGVEDVVIENDHDDFPPAKDRTYYAIATEWLEQRIVEAFQTILPISGKQEITPRLFFVGSMLIDEKQVPCYLARGLADKKWFVDAEARLRARSGAGPGIVFCGQDPGWKCIAANIIMTIPHTSDPSAAFETVDAAFVETFFRANMGLAFGGSALTLIQSEDGESGTLHAPGMPDLALFSGQQVRCFRLLVDAKKKGLTAVKTSTLIEGSKSMSLQQMLGAKRWPVFKDYLDDVGQGWWSIKTN
ncbi:hypothetical protein GCM10007315_35440 [Gemmobacter tilapiae]|uniref:Uncharacterized protein n=2 Tax=Neogemmobacter tilapiae TaxID=875041 RepID=A0A918TY43_9RHOB|nr:hypothetical protein GCM10007315_35440 [Gemmobacter tilapiae]